MKRQQSRRARAALEPPGLVLGHAVVVRRVGAGQAFRGKVAALAPDVAINLDRAWSSEAFRVGDLVRAVHLGRQALEATVTASAHGVVRLQVTVQTSPSRDSCDRCGAAFAHSSSTMSYFNTDAICAACKADEELAPGYGEAVRVEVEHVRAGNMNYEGIGLSPADTAFLAERRSQR